MKFVILVVISVSVGISASIVGVILNSDLDMVKTDCDIQKDQIFEMGKRFEEIRELQKETSPGTNDNFRLDQEFQKLTDEVLEKRNWYIANCLE